MLSTIVHQGEDDGLHICKPFECFNLLNGRPLGRIAVETLHDSKYISDLSFQLGAHLRDQMFDGCVDFL